MINKLLKINIGIDYIYTRDCELMQYTCRHSPAFWMEWSDGAMVLDKLPVPGRPTILDYSMARAYCACSRCGLFGYFSSRLSFLPFSEIRPDIDCNTAQRAVKPRTTNQYFGVSVRVRVTFRICDRFKLFVFCISICFSVNGRTKLMILVPYLRRALQK